MKKKYKEESAVELSTNDYSEDLSNALATLKKLSRLYPHAHVMTYTTYKSRQGSGDFSDAKGFAFLWRGESRSVHYIGDIGVSALKPEDYILWYPW